MNAECGGNLFPAQFELGLRTGNEVVHTSMLHSAKVIATRKCCNSGKDGLGRWLHNVAMAKKAKRKEAPPAGHFLREWREFREMTQEDLAATVKPPTNASMISLLESGGRGLSNKWLARLAPALRTKKGRLLDMNPFEADTDVLEIWGIIPDDERPRVLNILNQFVKRAK